VHLRVLDKFSEFSLSPLYSTPYTKAKRVLSVEFNRSLLFVNPAGDQEGLAVVSVQAVN
jgi:hypothetical protein